MGILLSQFFCYYMQVFDKLNDPLLLVNKLDKLDVFLLPGTCWKFLLSNID